MTLAEMSEAYRTQSQILDGRIRLLTAIEKGLEDEREQCLIRGRIDMLAKMRREAQELALVTGRYYERGYRRNERYSL